MVYGFWGRVWIPVETIRELYHLSKGQDAEGISVEQEQVQIAAIVAKEKQRNKGICKGLGLGQENRDKEKCSMAAAVMSPTARGRCSEPLSLPKGSNVVPC